MTTRLASVVLQVLLPCLNAASLALWLCFAEFLWKYSFSRTTLCAWINAGVQLHADNNKHSLLCGIYCYNKLTSCMNGLYWAVCSFPCHIQPKFTELKTITTTSRSIWSKKGSWWKPDLKLYSLWKVSRTQAPLKKPNQGFNSRSCKTLNI